MPRWVVEVESPGGGSQLLEFAAPSRLHLDQQIARYKVGRVERLPGRLEASPRWTIAQGIGLGVVVVVVGVIACALAYYVAGIAWEIVVDW